MKRSLLLPIVLIFSHSLTVLAADAQDSEKLDENFNPETGVVTLSEDDYVKVITGEAVPQQSRVYRLEDDRPPTRSAGPPVNLENMIQQGDAQPRSVLSSEVPGLAAMLFFTTTLGEMEQFRYENQLKVVTSLYHVEQAEAAEFIAFLNGTKALYRSSLDEMMIKQCDAYGGSLSTTNAGNAVAKYVSDLDERDAFSRQYFENALNELRSTFSAELVSVVNSRIEFITPRMRQVNISNAAMIEGTDLGVLMNRINEVCDRVRLRNN